MNTEAAITGAEFGVMSPNTARPTTCVRILIPINRVIQSGAALNIGEQICSRAKSDMQMEMGSNSYNSGDCNEMRYCDDLRDGTEEQP